MDRFRNFLKQVTVTQWLLFAVVVFLFLNWLQMIQISHSLKNLNCNINGAACDGHLPYPDNEK